MKKAWNYFRERYIEIHGMLFTIFSLITFFVGNADSFFINNISSFFNAITISQTNTVTSPNKKAVMVSKVLPTLFSVHEN